MEIGHGILSLGAIVFRLGAIETLSSSVRVLYLLCHLVNNVEDSVATKSKLLMQLVVAEGIKGVGAVSKYPVSWQKILSR